MTLTEINYYVRKMAPLAVIMGLVLVIIIVAFQLLAIYLKKDQPVQVVETTPTVFDTKFNKITAPIIPQSKSPKSYKFVLDTIDGTTKMETATSAAKIYFIPKRSGSFGYLSQIYQMAKNVGIDTDKTDYVKTDTTAKFDDGKRSLSVDITNYNFTYDFIINKGEDINFGMKETPLDGTLTNSAVSFLTTIWRYPIDFAQSQQHIIYLTFNTETKQISTLENGIGANMAEIDFYRPDVDGMPVVTSSYYNSPHYVLFAYDINGLKVVRAQVKYFEASMDQSGLYPIKTSDQAWADLQKGVGYVVSSNKPDGQIAVKKIVLAYFDPDVYQEYLQPVYVFLGDDKFAAYVPAVTDEYIQVK